jgi:hypothetical protein
MNTEILSLLLIEALIINIVIYFLTKNIKLSILYIFSLLATLSLYSYFSSSIIENKESLFFPDEFYYNKYAVEIIKYGFDISNLREVTGTTNYSMFVYVALHYLIAEDKLLVVVSNSNLLILTAAFMYKIIYLMFNKRRYAYYAFILIAFNPFSIFWSIFLVKDTYLMFLVILILYLTMRPLNFKRILPIALILLSLYLVLLTRFYFAGIIITILLISVLYSSKYSKKIILPVLAIISIYFIYTSYLSIIGDYIVRSSHVASEAGYSTSLVSITNPITYFISFFHFIFAPSPFNLNGDGKYLIYGQILWYLMIPLVVLGYLKTKSNRATFYSMDCDKTKLQFSFFYKSFPTIVILATTLMPAINEPRHRLVLLPFFIVFFINGLVYESKQKKLLLLIIFAEVILIAIMEYIRSK